MNTFSVWESNSSDCRKYKVKLSFFPSCLFRPAPRYHANLEPHCYCSVQSRSRRRVSIAEQISLRFQPFKKAPQSHSTCISFDSVLTCEAVLSKSCWSCYSFFFLYLPWPFPYILFSFNQVPSAVLSSKDSSIVGEILMRWHSFPWVTIIYSDQYILLFIIKWN